MDKQKVYIIFTYNILPIGGTQMYTAGKANYLKQNGWKVFVFFNGANVGNAAIPSLTEYVKTGGGLGFLVKPPYKFKSYEQKSYLDLMIKRLNLPKPDEYEIIIESHYDVGAYWAELLASKIGARHFFISCNEIYRMPGKYYEDNLDYFYFKWKRNEIAFSKVDMVTKLFNGYKGITKPRIEMLPVVREPNSIQDVKFPEIDKIKKLDWNICHYGRIAKPYVPYVIEGVGQLARRHPNKKINFIFIGNATAKLDLINKTLGKLPNVKLTFLGDLVPVPRILFSKIDVVCAMAGAAKHAAWENVYVIAGNANNPHMTQGVLGYDTNEATFGECKYTWLEALENVLVNRLYENEENKYPKDEPVETYYEHFWDIVKNANSNKEYYIEGLSKERIRDWTAIFPFSSVARGARVIFFGETAVTKDYREQIASQSDVKIEIGKDSIEKLTSPNYCEIVATVDENSDKFDDSVVGVDRLKSKDYDAIIISTLPQQAQLAYNKILKLVPDMKERIIYNFKIIRI